MELAYIGLFSQIFDWVLSHIFDPVYRFVSGLLTTALAWLFNEILAPILMPILQDVLNFAIDLWLMIYCTQLYTLLSGILKIIDYMQTAFDTFIGLADVTYREPGGAAITGSLLEVLMQQKTFSTVFWLITLGGLGLALILTIYATAKSAFDLDFENKRPVSKVLASMMKTFVQFFTVPFLVYFMVKLSAVILRGVTNAMSIGGSTSLGRIVFVIASLDAAKDTSYNVSTTTRDITLGMSREDVIRYPFYTLGGGSEPTRDYGNLKEVADYFNLQDMDFVIGYIAAIFLLFTIGVCLIVFIQRIFEILLLYLVSPYFVCTMPLDDGEKFSKWREMFIAKCFSGFGSAVSMRLFLLICPILMGGRIKFGVNSSPEMDYLIKLFFLVGGAWAVYKSGPIITSLLNAQAGQSEASTAAMAGGFLFAQTAGRAIAKGKGAMVSGARKAGQSKKGQKGGKDGKGEEGSEKDGAFKGTKNEVGSGAAKPGMKNAGGSGKGGDAKAGKGGISVKTDGGGLSGKPGDEKAGDDKSKFDGSSLAEKAGSIKDKAEGADSTGKEADKDKEKEGGINMPDIESGIRTEGEDSDEKDGAFTGTQEPADSSAGDEEASDAEAEAADAEAADADSEPSAEEGKAHHNYNLGALYTSVYDADGNRMVRILGFRHTEDSQGRTTSRSFPGLITIRKDMDTGHHSIAQLKIPGVAKIRTNIEGGKLKYSDVSLPGFKYSSHGGETHMKSLGMKYHQQEDGSSKLNVGSGFSLGSNSEGSMESFRLGKHKVSYGEEGMHYSLGSKIHVTAGPDDKLDSISVGGLNYHKTGKIARNTESQKEQEDKA